MMCTAIYCLFVHQNLITLAIPCAKLRSQPESLAEIETPESVTTGSDLVQGV